MALPPLIKTRKNIVILILLAIAFVAGLLIPSPIYRFYHGISVSEIGKTVFLVKDTTGMYLPDGSVYEGTVSALTGKPEGYGDLKSQEGSYIGTWHDGLLIYGKHSTDTANYEGAFDKSLNYGGFGIQKYTAAYVDSQLQKGISPGKIPVVYAGNWNNGVPNGLGRFVMADTSINFGRFSNGRLIPESGRQFMTGKNVYGIDISHYQGMINWDILGLWCDSTGAVFRSVPRQKKYMQPVLFTFIKATDGKTGKDRTYPSRVREAKRHGIIHGAYHFLRYNSSGKDQATNFMSWAHWLKGDLPPVLDVEDENEIIKCGEQKFLAIVFEWLEEVEKQWGVRPIIYTTDRIRKIYLAEDKRYANYDYWISRYSSTPPHTPGWKFWQFTMSGIVNGIGVYTDLDLYFSDYKSLIRYLDITGN